MRVLRSPSLAPLCLFLSQPSPRQPRSALPHHKCMAITVFVDWLPWGVKIVCGSTEVVYRYSMSGDLLLRLGSAAAVVAVGQAAKSFGLLSQADGQAILKVIFNITLPSGLLSFTQAFLSASPAHEPADRANSAHAADVRLNVLTRESVSRREILSRQLTSLPAAALPAGPHTPLSTHLNLSCAPASGTPPQSSSTASARSAPPPPPSGRSWPSPSCTASP